MKRYCLVLCIVVLHFLSQSSGRSPESECKDERKDCVKIVIINQGRQEYIDQYCKRYRNDPAVKKCNKTCGFCKAPAPPQPETSQECKDERKDCAKIVTINQGRQEYIDDYCKRYRNDPAVKECNKTCGFCQVPAQPQPEQSKVCEDTRVGGCSWIKEEVANPAEYCETWKDDEAIKQCQKTCGVCK